MKRPIHAQAIDVHLGGILILANVELALTPGQVVAVLGENGSGKSTLVRALAGLTPVSGGAVELHERPIGSFRAIDRAGLVACTLQDNPLAFDFTVHEVATMGVQPETPHEHGELRVDRALRLLGLESFGKRAWSTLSGGQRQRTHIARLLATEAAVLLLDEPQNHLDLATRVCLRAALRGEAERGAAVLFTTHDLEEAAWADEVVILSGGQVVARGAPSETLSTRLVQSVFHVNARELKDPLGGPPAFRIDASSKRHISSHR